MVFDGIKCQVFSNRDKAFYTKRSFIFLCQSCPKCHSSVGSLARGTLNDYFELMSMDPWLGVSLWDPDGFTRIAHFQSCDSSSLRFLFLVSVFLIIIKNAFSVSLLNNSPERWQRLYQKFSIILSSIKVICI